MIGDGFALIQCGRADNNALERLQHPLWDSLAAKRILIEPADAQATLDSAGTVKTLKDAQNSLPAALFESRAIILLRPDRYIAAIFDCNDEAHVAQALEALFNTQHAIPNGNFALAAEALR